MDKKINFFVNAIHSIGGVTSWSFQASKFLSENYQSQVSTFSNSQENVPNTHLFPDKGISLTNKVRANEIDQKHLRRDEIKKKSQKNLKTSKTSKKHLPLKEEKIPMPIKESWSRLNPSAELIVKQTNIFIPNYIEFGYRLAAISRSNNVTSRCIGICHTDHDSYYNLLSKYEPIIQSFIAVSTRCEQKLHELIPHRKDDVHLLPYGVDIPNVIDRLNSSQQIRIIYSGRFVKEQKRILDLVKLINKLESAEINYVFDFWGNGPDEVELASAVKGFSRVRICKGVTQSQMPNVYRNYDIIVLSSETEGTSISMLEGMANGLIPVVTRVSGAEDVISHGRNGFLVDVGDVNGLCNKIELLSRDNDLKTDMSRNAYETARKSYSSNSQLLTFSKIIEEVEHKPLVSREAALGCLY
jgi:glycosyltransferase involved in cell wall biosynthesis